MLEQQAEEPVSFFYSLLRDELTPQGRIQRQPTFMRRLSPPRRTKPLHRVFLLPETAHGYSASREFSKADVSICRLWSKKRRGFNDMMTCRW
jgi:hypothetical protein